MSKPSYQGIWGYHKVDLGSNWGLLFCCHSSISIKLNNSCQFWSIFLEIGLVHKVRRIISGSAAESAGLGRQSWGVFALGPMAQNFCSELTFLSKIGNKVFNATVVLFLHYDEKCFCISYFVIFVLSKLKGSNSQRWHVQVLEKWRENSNAVPLRFLQDFCEMCTVLLPCTLYCSLFGQLMYCLILNN